MATNSVRMRFDGMDDAMRQLLALPSFLALDTRPGLIAEAQAAATEIRASYPHRTGRLAGGVEVQATDVGATKTVVRVVNRTLYSGWYERGTKDRRTRAGWPRGAATAGNVFIPIMQRHRRLAYALAGRSLNKAGLKVVGSA